MCGICGVVQIGGEPRAVIGSDDLLAMTDAMTHRGPNDRGIYEAPGIAIGVRRLSIVDVEGGHQPVENEDGAIVAAQNGELYNHLDLRSVLRGDHRYQSRCDTEILPHLYEEDGADFPARLRGKFAACVWDGRERRAVIARDRLGVKPLYWSRVGDLVVFASELRALIASGLVDVELDLEAVDAYLTLGYFPGVATPIAGVHKLLPGHRLVVDASGVSDAAYWEYPLPETSGRVRPIEEYADELQELLAEAVRLRLMSDVPLGVMLSGGLDSSLIVALMARELSSPVKTFSVGFVEDREGNELADARRVAELFATEHHELELSFTQTGIDLDALAWEIDEPVADLSAFGFLMLSALAAEHVTVALAGQGADELFGGYRKHRVASAFRALGPARGAFRPLAGRARPGQTAARRTLGAAGAASSGEMLLAMSGLLDPALRRALYRGPLADVAGNAALTAVSAAGGTRRFDDPLAALLYLDAQLALPEDMLLYFDRASMARSLEVRVPFLDHEVVEWAARVPTQLKVRRLETKLVLKQAARGLLPDSIIDKKKVGFFRYASHAWLVSQLRGELGGRLVAPTRATAGLLDAATVQRLVDDELAGKRSRTQLLLAITMLELWLTSLQQARSGVAAVSA
jgi:asparagine synthase (glutamine-hydrolysing)